MSLYAHPQEGPDAPDAALLRTRGAGLRVTQEGAGDDVLLIGGLTEDASAWEAQAQALTAAGRRVTRYDARGIGVSPTPPGPYRLADLVADAVEALDASGIDEADVVGSGLGGAIAQHLAIEHPERVRTLTLSASWARSDRALRALLLNWLWTAERATGVDELLQSVNRWIYAPDAWNSGAADDSITQAVIAEVRAGADGWRRFRDAFTWTAWAALEHDATAGLARITAPALLIAGAQDAVLGDGHTRELAALLRDADIEVLPGAGHRPHQEQPAAFNARLERFLTASADRRALAA